MSGKRNDSRILTYSGVMFDPLNPSAKLICIEDISHALSNICRYNGHIRDFYSVGQHSVIVSIIVEKFGVDFAAAGLLHDGSEAFICDIVNPVKHSKEFEEFYVPIEERLQSAINGRFGLATDAHLSYPVALADKLCYFLERRSMFPEHPGSVDSVEFERLLKFFGENWRDYNIKPFEPYVAKAMFMKRYDEIFTKCLGRS